MSKSFTFVAYGLPAPQGSKRHVGNGVLVESSQNVKPWRTDVKHAALACLPLDWNASGPVSLSIIFRFKRPASHIGKKGVRPSAPQHNTSARHGDLDKLQRATFDALTGVAFNDDRQVVSVNASKRYCVDEEPQGAVITLMLLSPDSGVDS
jgi:crossover junction endodeoxyribonuclease RusA